VSLSTPQQIQERLEAIEGDLAIRQNVLEKAAMDWYKAKRDREANWARAYISADGPAHVRKAEADLAVATVGINEEAEYEALRAVVRTLETRATIGMALLKTQARAGA
jgi:hypothetical protein